MKTQIIKINSVYPEVDAISYAAGLIRAGKLVAFPTETVYGLGANALDSQAVSNIFTAKGRPLDNPVIVHVVDIKEIERYVQHVPKITWKLAKTFWPGPLTLLLERQKNIPDVVTAGSSLVSIRIPNNPVALALLRESQLPIAAPSANSSGRPSPTDAEHVSNDLDGKVDLILDGGPTAIGLESTVVDITSNPSVILRPGGVSLEMLQGILPQVVFYAGSDEKPRAPGMKYTHYSPQARITVYLGNREFVNQKIIENFEENKTIIITDSIVLGIPKSMQYILPTPEDYAKQMFSIFRNADKLGMKKILVKGIPEIELGAAVMNRLKKAATEIIIQK